MAPTTLDSWPVAFEPRLCPHCDRRYLYPASAAPPRCPLCFQEELVSWLLEAEQLPYVRPPELVMPFAVSEARFAEQIAAFASSIPFTPSDLTPANLQRRGQRVFVPHWLVDAEVEARFQADVGFDYQVVSHREAYVGDHWQTQQVREDRVRWEPRAGTLHRHYPNLLAPALEAEAVWQQRLGSYAESEAVSYQPESIDGVAVVLPDRSPADAWPEAIPALRQRAQEECRQAAQANHIRDFRWSPTYSSQHWTQFLRPVYTTFYLDDEGQPHLVFLNGQTGQIGGSRRASMARARRLTLALGLVAALLLFLSLALGAIGIFFDVRLNPFAAATLALAFLFLLGALAPLAVVWRFNRSHS